MEKDYRHKGLELTPSIFAELLIKFYDGKQFDRRTAVSSILDYHIQNGGIVKKGKDIVAVFKKATSNLKDYGIQNVGYGTWRLNYIEKETTIVEPKKPVEYSFIVDKEIGEGQNAVYLYYYDAYKELAELKDLQSWECKIGRTDVEPIQRIMGQAGTCYPEFPHIALVMYCEDSSQLELAIHSILKVQKKNIESAPGKEWFITSPQEIEEIYFMIMKHPL